MFDVSASIIGDEETLWISSAFSEASGATIVSSHSKGLGNEVHVSFTKVRKLPSQIDSLFWNSLEISDLLLGVVDVQYLKEDDNVDSLTWVIHLKEEYKGEYSTYANLIDFPYLTLPEDGYYGGQKVFIRDGLGAGVISATKAPVLLEGLAESMVMEQEPDTFVVIISEKLVLDSLKDWGTLFLAGNSCDLEMDAFYPLELSQTPLISADSLEFTLYVNKNIPFVENCIILNPVAQVTDLYNNPNAAFGTAIKGNNGFSHIHYLEVMPAVVGLKNHSLEWIRPVMDEYGNVFTPQDIGQLPTGEDYNLYEPLPHDYSAIKVIASSPYMASIMIYDNAGQFVRKIEQSFGYHGELFNQERNSEAKGKVSFLYWDMLDQQGKRVASGLYIYRIYFRYPNAEKADVLMKKVGYTRSQ
jgi:hypothetical protein